jgi:hypothetical protein
MPSATLTCRRGEETAFFERYRLDRDPAVRNALAERFMPLARHLANRYPSGAEREDVLQVAALALVEAVDRFDPNRGGRTPRGRSAESGALIQRLATRSPPRPSSLRRRVPRSPTARLRPAPTREAA